MKAIVLIMVGATLTQAPTYRTSIERVQLDVSATRNGRAVSGLTAADFVVTDKGVVQTIESATQEDSALCVQLVLDMSGSVSGDRLRRLVDATTALLDLLRSSDRAGLITFSTSVEIRAPMTHDRDRVKRALADARSGGMTSLRDGVELALGTTSCDDARSLVIVFSDGADTVSWLSDTEVIESARRLGTVIHVVAVRAPTVTSRFLPNLTEAVGGRMFSASSVDDLTRLFTGALSEMRGRYLITFTPQSSSSGWHELKVSGRARGIDIKARPGYFVRAAP